MPLQRFSDRLSRCRLRTNAQINGFKPFEHHPGRERAHRATCVLHVRFNGLADEFLRPEDHTTKCAALTVDMLCCAVYDDICTKLYRI